MLLYVVRLLSFKVFHLMFWSFTVIRCIWCWLLLRIMLINCCVEVHQSELKLFSFIVSRWCIKAGSSWLSSCCEFVVLWLVRNSEHCEKSKLANKTFFFSFPFPFMPLQRRGCLVAPFVSLNRFSTLCRWLAQQQGWRVKGWIWWSEQPRSAKANSWLDYQMGDRKW
jgi:hypothetical protein